MRPILILLLAVVLFGCSPKQVSNHYGFHIASSFSPDMSFDIQFAASNWQLAISGVNALHGDLTFDVSMTPDLPFWHDLGDDIIQVVPSDTIGVNNMYKNENGGASDDITLLAYTMRGSGDQSTIYLNMDLLQHQDGAFIVEVITHEIGHSLGLRHTGFGTLMCSTVECQSDTITQADIDQFNYLR